MAVRHVILRQFPTVPDLGFFDGIGHIAFLAAKVACVYLVLDEERKRRLLEKAAVNGSVPRAVQIIADCPERFALKVEGKHPPYNHGLFRDDDVLFLPVIVPIAEDVLVCRADFS